MYHKFSSFCMHFCFFPVVIVSDHIFPLKVIQITDITLFSRAVYKCTVDEAEYE